MAKIATVKLFWKKSPSSDVARAEVKVTIDGVESAFTVGPEVEEQVVEVKASGAVSFHVITFDKEGLQSTSTVYSAVLPDFEAPAPATDLGHEVLSVREVT